MVSGLSLFVIVAYMAYNISTSSPKVFSISVFALMAGLLFESFRISDSWLSITITLFVIFIFCFHPFLIGTSLFYAGDGIKYAPYVFIGFFALIMGLYYIQNPTRQINESLTLIQSLAVVYWILDYTAFDVDNWFVKIGVLFALFCAAFSLFNALTYYVLSNIVRVALSVWSAMAMLLLSADNIYRVFQNSLTNDSQYLSANLHIGIQFFFLGISSIYVVTNFFLIFSFLPSSNTFFNAAYFKGINELTEMHLRRYTDEQVWIGHSILCIVLTGLFYWCNYKYQFLPKNTAIWVGFWLFPLLFRIATHRQRKARNSYYQK